MEEKIVFDFMVESVPKKARYVFLNMVSKYKKTTQKKAMSLHCSINLLYVILTRAEQLISQCKE